MRIGASNSNNLLSSNGLPIRSPTLSTEKLSTGLDQALRAPGATAVLYGKDGVGKSQQAIKYAYRHQTLFDVIWWIPSDSSVQLMNALVELAHHLRISTE